MKNLSMYAGRVAAVMFVAIFVCSIIAIALGWGVNGQKWYVYSFHLFVYAVILTFALPALWGKGVGAQPVAKKEVAENQKTVSNDNEPTCYVEMKDLATGEVETWAEYRPIQEVCDEVEAHPDFMYALSKCESENAYMLYSAQVNVIPNFE